jgi:uncharacterized membrane protein YphA (DoxX/SURF4 family)
MTHISANDTLHKGNTFKRIVSFSWVKKSVLVEVIALLFVILFLYTGVAKLMEFDVFEEQLAESPILAPIASVVAWGMPVTEFIISLLLFFPRYRLKGLYLTSILMTLFTAYIITLFTISPELPCSCGGILEALSWKGHLVFNSLLILLSLVAIRMQRGLKRSKEINGERYLTNRV